MAGRRKTQEKAEIKAPEAKKSTRGRKKAEVEVAPVVKPTPSVVSKPEKKLTLKLSEGDRVKRLSKDVVGTVESVKLNDEGLALKATVIWDSGSKYVVSGLDLALV